MARVLSISYDLALLRIRELVLKQLGHDVISAEGFAHAYRAFDEENGNFDLIILGHSIPHEDKQAIITKCRRKCSSPVLALLRSNELSVDDANRSVQSDDPQAFIAAVNALLAEFGTESTSLAGLGKH